MGFAAIKERARALFDEAGFIGHIASEDDYAQALALMDEWVDDYEANRRCSRSSPVPSSAGKTSPMSLLRSTRGWRNWVASMYSDC